MTQTPKAVVFDIGNVLLQWDPDKLYAQLLPDPDERAAIFAELDLMDMNEALDLGAPFKETVYAKAEEYPEHRDLIRAWHDRWIEMAYALIDGSWDILRDLKTRGVPVFALSNFGVDSYAQCQQVYPALTEFDREFISGRMKMIKPDPAIYEALEADTGLSGADLTFFDDRADNIAAANARGWQGHIFTTPAQMKADLAEMGL